MEERLPELATTRDLPTSPFQLRPSIRNKEPPYEPSPSSLSMGNANYMHKQIRLAEPPKVKRAATARPAPRSRPRSPSGKPSIVELLALEPRPQSPERDSNGEASRSSEPEPTRDSVLASLEADKARLQMELAQVRDALEVALVEASALLQGLELDRAMAPSSGPIRLNAQNIGEMYHYISFGVLKRERNRRMEIIEAQNKLLKEKHRERNADMKAMRRTINELERQHDADVETIDRLRLKLKTVDLCAADKATVVKTLEEGAVAERPWEEPKTSFVDLSALGEWTFESWLEPLLLHKIFAQPFNLTLREVDKTLAPDGLANSEGRQAFLHALGRHGSRDTIVAMLRAAPLLDDLATSIWQAVQDLTAQLDQLAEGVAKPRERDEKPIKKGDMYNLDFMRRQPAFLTFAPPKMFNATLRELVGSPSMDGLSAMTREHTMEADSEVSFVAGLHQIHTTSKVEWYLVVEPDKALADLGLEEWPNGKTPMNLGCRDVHKPDSEHFTKLIEATNAKLFRAGDREKISLEIFCALRMFAGPMYTKYNLAIRNADKNLASDFTKDFNNWYSKFNMYPTTLLNICLGINKLSLITKATKVYRAPGGQLRSSFFDTHPDGTRGGVEMGFTLTTTDKEEAVKYATSSGSVVILELQQGMHAKGADLRWLSQFPLDAQVVFGPLTICEVHRVRTEGALRIVELRPAVSSAASRTRAELYADERLADTLHMMRNDEDRTLNERINAAVSSMGGYATGLAPLLDTQRGRARVHHTSTALMAQASVELAAAVSSELEPAEELAASNPGQLELRALAEGVKRRVQFAAEEEARLKAWEGAAKADFRRVDRSGRSRESQSRAKSRFAKLGTAAFKAEEPTREPVAESSAFESMVVQALQRANDVRAARLADPLTGYP